MPMLFWPNQGYQPFILIILAFFSAYANLLYREIIDGSEKKRHFTFNFL